MANITTKAEIAWIHFMMVEGRWEFALFIRIHAVVNDDTTVMVYMVNE